MKIDWNNTIVKMIIFFIINVFLVNIDYRIDSMLFTSLFRPVICFVAMWLLVKDKVNLKENINKIPRKQNIIFLIVIIIIVIPFRVINKEVVIPMFWKSNLIENILYYFSAFMIATYEEINFRYIFTDIVDEALESYRISAVFSTVIFALMHMTNYYSSAANFANILGSFILGLGLFVIYYKYGLLQSCLLHFVYNISLVLFLDYNNLLNGITMIIYNIIFILVVILLLRITEKVFDNKFKKQ